MAKKISGVKTSPEAEPVGVRPELPRRAKTISKNSLARRTCPHGGAPVIATS
jgi:hypothetical protein